MAESESTHTLTGPGLVEAFFHGGFQREADEVQFFRLNPGAAPRLFRHLAPGPMVLELVNGDISGVLNLLSTDDASEAAQYAAYGTLGANPVEAYPVSAGATHRRVFSPLRAFTVARWTGGPAVATAKGVAILQHTPSLLKLAAQGFNGGPPTVLSFTSPA